MKASDGRIQFLIQGLIAWIFLSKISFGGFLPFFPRQFPYLIFQQGLHPYLNVVFCALLGFPLIFLFLRVEDRNRLSPFYKIFLVAVAVTLSLQTFLQIFYVNFTESAVLQIGALGSSLFMVLIYGWIIPSLWSWERVVRLISKWCGVLVLLSILLLLVHPSGAFKGGRFIGIFKHIPYMVTCATVAFIFHLLPTQHKIWRILVLVTSFAAIVLTGTRSSAGAAILALGLSFILFEAKSTLHRLQKIAIFVSLVLVTIFFGQDLFEYAQGVATGKNALMMREAQDGVASRKEEFERGLQMFEEHPWLGQGLVSKFAAGNEVDVSNYNAMKDPHNIFVSAGVIGGWPMLMLSIMAIVLMTVGCLKILMRFRRDPSQLILAIYLLSHIPILIIYHVHLSLGGMADRIYWLVFGLLAISSEKILSRKEHELRGVNPPSNSNR